MPVRLVHPPKALPGDGVAVLSPYLDPALVRADPDAVVCVGVPSGHTSPQWLLPHGGEATVDGAHREVWADYRWRAAGRRAPLAPWTTLGVHDVVLDDAPPGSR